MNQVTIMERLKGKKKETINDKELRRKTRLTSKSPFSVREAYKIARTNIMFSTAEEGCKRIGITSSYPGEGKTTTCVNLALSFAQTGRRVLIIDCDMRKPQMHNVFGFDNLVGLSNILGGFAKVSETIHFLEEENLHIITSGQIPPNPAELIGSNRMKVLIEELSQSYDYIFIDTPPVNVVTDAVVLSPNTSGLVVVTKQGQSTHKDLEQALGKIEFGKVKVLGLILTGEKRKGSTYGKYGKYGKYGNYQGYAAYEQG